MTILAIKEAVEFEDTFLQNKIERRAYEQREKAIRDYYSYMSAFKEVVCTIIIYDFIISINYFITIIK